MIWSEWGWCGVMWDPQRTRKGVAPILGRRFRLLSYVLTTDWSELIRSSVWALHNMAVRVYFVMWYKSRCQNPGGVWPIHDATEAGSALSFRCTVTQSVAFALRGPQCPRWLQGHWPHLSSRQQGTGKGRDGIPWPSLKESSLSPTKQLPLTSHWPELSQNTIPTSGKMWLFRCAHWCLK